MEGGFSPSGIGVNFPEGTDIFVTRISANGGDLYASSFIEVLETTG